MVAGRDSSISPASPISDQKNNSNNLSTNLASSPSGGNSNNTSANATATNLRSILAVFTKYEKDRMLFAQTVADIASRDQNIDVLIQQGTISLFKPLLVDTQPSIRQAAAVTIGRVANLHAESAQAVVEQGLLKDLVTGLESQNVKPNEVSL